MPDVWTKVKAGSDFIQGTAIVNVNKFGTIQKVNPEDLDAAYQSGILNHQSGVLDTRFDDVSYYTS